MLIIIGEDNKNVNIRIGASIASSFRTIKNFLSIWGKFPKYFRYFCYYLRTFHNVCKYTDFFSFIQKLVSIVFNSAIHFPSK